MRYFTFLAFALLLAAVPVRAENLSAFVFLEGKQLDDGETVLDDCIATYEYGDDSVTVYCYDN